jgi:hypothetical protein
MLRPTSDEKIPLEIMSAPRLAAWLVAQRLAGHNNVALLVTTPYCAAAEGAQQGDMLLSVERNANCACRRQHGLP